MKDETGRNYVEVATLEGGKTKAYVGDLIVARSPISKDIRVVKIESIKKRFSVGGWKLSPRPKHCVFFKSASLQIRG